jgi:hypothetical protein
MDTADVHGASRATVISDAAIITHPVACQDRCLDRS